MKSALFKPLAFLFCFAGFSFLFGAEWYVNYEKALDAIERKQWQAAISQLNAALSEKSDEKENAKTYGLRFIDYFPYLYRGIAYYHLGDYDQALADLQKSESFGEVRKASRDKDAQQKLRSYLKLVNQQMQLAETQKQVETTFSSGVALFKEKKFQAAKSKFEEVLKLDAKHVEAKDYLDKIEGELSKMQMAEAKQKRQEQVADTFDQGVEYFKQKDFNKAEKRFQEVLSLDETNSQATHYLDLIKAERERLAQIDSEFKVGVNFYKQAKFEQAKNKFRNVLTLDANHQGAKDYLKKIADKQSALAKVDATPKSETKPAATNHIDAKFEEALQLFKQGQLTEAKQKFSVLTSDNAKYSETKEYLNKIVQIEENARAGITAFFEGENEKSIEYLTQVTEVYNTNAQIYAVLGSAYATQYLLHGEDDLELFENALQCFRESKQLDASYQLDQRFFSPRIVEIYKKL